MSINISKSKLNNEPNDYQGSNMLLLGICLAVLAIWIFGMSASMVQMPKIAESLKVSEADLSTPLSLTGLFSGVLIVLAGRFADNYGRVRFTIIGLIANVLGSLLLIVAPNVFVLSLGKALLGVAAACIMPATLSLVKSYYQGDARHRAVTRWSMSSWGGAAVASILVGAITTAINWRISYVFSIVMSIAAFFLIVPTPESKAKEKPRGLDIPGLFFLVTGLLSLNVFVSNVRKWGLSSVYSVVLLAYAIVAIILLIYIEKRAGKRAIIDMEVFKSAKFNITTLSNLIFNLTAGGSLYVLIAYAQDVFKLDPMHSGLLTVGYLVMVLIALPLGEKIMLKSSPKKPMIIGSLITMGSFVLLALTALPQVVYYGVSFVALALMGFGLGMYATPSTDTALSELSDETSATGSGVYKMASSLGASFGIVIAGSLYTIVQDAHSAAMAFVTMLCFSTLALITVLQFKSRPVAAEVGPEKAGKRAIAR